MSTQSSVVGFGPFRRTIANHLEYPAEWYDDTKEGTLVYTSLMHMNTRDHSERLLEALTGSFDILDFNHHQIDVDKINFQELSGFVDSTDIVAIITLASHGFTLLFHPDC